MNQSDFSLYIKTTEHPIGLMHQTNKINNKGMGNTEKQEYKCLHRNWSLTKSWIREFKWVFSIQSPKKEKLKVHIKLLESSHKIQVSLPLGSATVELHKQVLQI